MRLVRLSTGSNAVIGKRSSGKTFSDRIAAQNEGSKHIKQFDPVECDGNSERFENHIKSKHAKERNRWDGYYGLQSIKELRSSDGRTTKNFESVLDCLEAGEVAYDESKRPYNEALKKYGENDTDTQNE